MPNKRSILEAFPATALYAAPSKIDQKQRGLDAHFYFLDRKQHSRSEDYQETEEVKGPADSLPVEEQIDRSFDLFDFLVLYSSESECCFRSREW